MALVTKVEVQARNKNKANIYLNEEFYAGASIETIYKLGIKKGLEVDEKKLEELLTEEEKHKALTKAVDYVSKFIKTEKQIKDYLVKKGFSEGAVNEAVFKLKEYKLIDDEMFVKSFTESKKNSSGKIKIKSMLLQKGIDKNLASSVDDYVENEQEVCDRLAIKFMKNKEFNMQNKQKLYRNLLQNGFSYDNVSYSVNKLFNGRDENENWN